MSLRSLTKCRMCRCTEEAACESGCAWEPGEQDLCTTCGEMRRAFVKWLHKAHRPTTNALLREMKRTIALVNGGTLLPYQRVRRPRAGTATR